MSSIKFKPIVALLVANLSWACAYPLYDILLTHHIKPLPLLTLTLIISALLSLIPLLFGDYERVERVDILTLMGAGVLIAVIRKGMLIVGLSMTSPIDGSIISTISPIVALIISVAVGIDSFNRGKVMGLVLGLAGAMGVILTGGGTAHSESGMWGNILILMCAFITAIYVVWFKSLLKKYKPITIMRWMFCTSALVIMPFGIKPLIDSNIHQYETEVLLALAYIVVVPTYMPNLLVNYALQYVSPTVTSSFAYLQPIVAGAITISLHLDKPNPITLLFALLIFLGVAVVIRSYDKKRSVD